MRVTRVALWAGATALALGLAACGASDSDKAGGAASAEARVLTLANPNDGAPGRPLSDWAEEVGRLSGGTLRIEFENGWRADEPGYEAGTLEDVEAGKVDMAWVGARAFDTVGVTSFQALLAPLLVDSYELQARVFEQGIPEQMLAGVSELGLVGIGVLPGPLRKVLGVSKPFVRPGDFEGQVVGIQDSALADTTLRALGATPLAVPTGGALDGLDAYEQQLASIFANSYDAEAGYVTANLNLWPRPLAIVMNEEIFESLTRDQQAALREAATATIPEALAAARAEEDESAPVLCRRGGMTFAVATDGDLAELRSALQPVYAELERDPETRSAIDAIASLKTQVAASAETSRCETGSTATSAETAPLDGVYELTTTREELLATGSPDDFLENWGAFRWVLDGGRFEMTQKNGASDRWATGTYVVHDDTVEIAVEDSGGTAPDDAHEQPGEVYAYTWSLYRDQLTLGPVAGAISPEPFRAKPWSRVADVPAGAAPGGTSVDGVYRTSVSREALGREAPNQIHDQNWGDFTLSLAGGRVTFEQRNDVAGYSTSGTYTVEGDTIVLEFTGGGNAGETFAARWSLYEDTLTFTADEALGAIPAPYVIEPWQRAG